MKIKWYGHAAFMITTDRGIRIIIDPYQPGAFDGALSYGKIADEADIVLTSHDHDDHNYIADIEGVFDHISIAGSHQVQGVRIKAVSSFHDPSRGKERGDNLLFVIEADGLRIAHMGDLGHTLEKSAIAELGPIDVLILPVGGLYTIDSQEATKVMRDIQPAITIPMHYKTDKCAFPIAGVEEFTNGKGLVRDAMASEIVVTKKTLPGQPEILLLKPAL
ncbi:MAG: MBL fold metallo-hydrolase [Syntrophus sp. (in: bacteria)]|nr:MBL fold metallo-hydrolase [Syntrophus sp. (in: bacteria)]